MELILLSLKQEDNVCIVYQYNFLTCTQVGYTLSSPIQGRVTDTVAESLLRYICFSDPLSLIIEQESCFPWAP